MGKPENKRIEKKIHDLLQDYKPEYKEEYWEMMQEKLDASVKKRKVRNLTYLKYAASVIILIGLSFYFITLPAEDVVSETSTNEKTEIRLEDGTNVWLNRTTRLVYPEKFNKKAREVALVGEAFFEVAANKEKEFVVKTLYAEISVLGTKFNINAYANDSIEEITVVEGSVKVSPVNGAQKAILNNGEKAIVFKNASSMITRLNDNPNFLSWQTNKLFFENTPLDKVTKTLSKHYHHKILVKDTNLKNIELTSTIFDQSMEQALEVVKFTLNLETEELKDSIFIKRKAQ